MVDDRSLSEAWVRHQRKSFNKRSPRRWFGLAALVLLTTSLILVEALRAAKLTPHPSDDADYRALPAMSLANPDALEAVELLTGLRVEPGNRVDLLLNGDGTYTTLLGDLAHARTTISIQMYYVAPGLVSDAMARVLCDRVRAGVRVRLLLDAFGAVEASSSWMKGLQRCGVTVVRFRPLEWYTLHSAADRSHVRAVVIDGRVAYTGGFGLADYWLGDGHHNGQWRETNVRVAGPAARGLQAAFAAAWDEATGELLADDTCFPDDAPASTVGPGLSAGVLFTPSTTGNTAAERFLEIAIRSAKQRLYITNSYFVPNAEFRRLLTEARDRGVDVRILTAGSKTDVFTPWLAGRFHYADLRAHGVRIYEYQPAMMHAKTMVVDGAWAMIGSTNFDNRSLAYNDEANLVVIDTAFGARMDSVFRADLRASREMTPAVTQAWPWWQLLLQRGAALLSRLL